MKRKITYLMSSVHFELDRSQSGSRSNAEQR